jgi:hypothetical protein
MLAPADVFTPGQLPIRPTNVYASRGTAERLFRKALERGLVPIVYGGYGVGKTSMARVLLFETEIQDRLVNIESAADKSMQDVFARCLERLGYTVSTKRVESASSTHVREQSGQAEASAMGWLRAVIASRRSNTEATNRQTEEQFVVTSPTDSRLIEICEDAGVVLLIDELHRATAEFTSDLSKFLKAFGNASCRRFRIVLLGTSSDASRLVAADPGVDRLLQEVHLKAMSEQEAAFVLDKGMADLKISIDPATVTRLVRTSVGSPSVLQYLALETAEAAIDREARAILEADVEAALRSFVETKQARLSKSYVAAIESIGEIRYRKQILAAMAECEDEYVTMEMIREGVSRLVGRHVPSTALSGPLRELKDERYGCVLSDVQRPDGYGRLMNCTAFRDPALKAFVRLQLLRGE